MKSKLIAIVGGFVVIMIGNGVIYGGLLAEYFNEFVARVPEGVIHQSVGHIFLGHFIQTIVLVWLFARMKVHSAKDGFITSGLLHLGMFAVFDLFIMGTFTLFQPMEMVIDVAINGFTGALGGLAIGTILGKFADA